MADISDDTSADLTDRIAAAIYTSMVTQARKKAEAIDPDVDRIRRVFNAAYEETDRSAAILMFALAEDMMVEGLKRNLNNKIRGGWESVVEPTGLLGTAGNRITLLHMLHWIRPQTANDLFVLKSIRNRFAHHAELDGFKDQKIRSWIANMTKSEAPIKEYMRERHDERSFSPREQYLLRACSVVSQLSADLIVGPASRKRNVDPRDVEGRSREEMLPNLWEVHRVLAELIVRLINSQERVAVKAD